MSFLFYKQYGLCDRRCDLLHCGGGRGRQDRLQQGGSSTPKPRHQHAQVRLLDGCLASQFRRTAKTRNPMLSTRSTDGEARFCQALKAAKKRPFREKKLHWIVFLKIQMQNVCLWSINICEMSAYKDGWSPSLKRIILVTCRGAYG